MTQLRKIGNVFPLFTALQLASADQGEGYQGYRLNQRSDPEFTTYRTANTNTGPAYILPEDPDVYLNATANVDSIRVDVANLVAKVDLDVKVLDLLHVSAGVDASIKRVNLQIDDVYARAELEARLGNVVKMVDDVLGSIDLNPLIASMGENVENVVGSATDAVGGAAEGVLGTGGGKPGSRPAGTGPGSGAGSGAGEGAGSAQQPLGAGSTTPGAQAAGDGSKPAHGPGSEDTASKPLVQNGPKPREPNILYFTADPATHSGMYLVLKQDSGIVKVAVDAGGTELYRSVVGSFHTHM